MQNSSQCGSENDATTKIDVSEVPDFFFWENSLIAKRNCASNVAKWHISKKDADPNIYRTFVVADTL